MLKFLFHAFNFDILISSLIMLLLAELQHGVLDYAKMMPDLHIAEEIDFEVWGKGFCERMVSILVRYLNVQGVLLICAVRI